MTRRPPGRSREGGHHQLTRRRAALSDAELHRLVRRRSSVLFVLLLAGLSLLVGRLVYLQGAQADHLQRLALHQQLGAFILPTERGRIFDRAGRLLVTNVEVDSVYAVPRAIRDRQAFARTVAPLLRMDPREIGRRLEPRLYFVWLKRKVSPETVAALRALPLDGQLGFLKEERRVYPARALAAHVLGFVGIDNQGLAGVELVYERTLRGRPGKAVAGLDAVGRPLLETRRLTAPPVNGSDLVLTIDQVIQHIAERELERALAETGAARGMVLVMVPRTGEILAMAVQPGFEPGAFHRVAPERWVNPAVSAVDEPGSTFKLITAAAALDSGRVDSTDTFACPPFLQLGKYRIRDVHRFCTRTQTLEDIIRHSSNVGAAQVAQVVGKEIFYDYIRRFGFGAPTGIDVPGESGGIVNPPAAWLGPGLETIGFGQGISTTALQLLTAASALANDGMLVPPHVVRMVRDREGRVVRAVSPQPARRVVTPETARAVLRMMVRTVEDGTGKLAAIPGYTVAGKTGTAQKPAPDGGYLVGRYIASFLGFVPVPDPRLAILVVLDEPRGAYFGGAVAAPVFREIASRTLWYLRVPPMTPLALPPQTP